jgi:hypothetical protein
MRTFALALLALVVVLVTRITAQNPTPVTVGWAEKMIKDNPAHDFGTVPRGGKLIHRFPITNIYAVRMEIVSLVSGCGCVTATAAKRVLEPRETTYIEVVMDTSRIQGGQQKAVAVRFTVGPEFVSSAEVRVSASVRGDIVFNPGQFNFGNVPRGQAPVMAVDVEYAGNLPWQIQEITIRKDFPFTITSKELYRQPGRVGYQLQLTLKADAPAGSIKEDLYLKTNDPASPTVPVLVEANVLPALAVAPNPLNLGAVKVGEVLVRRVVVRGNKPFVVTGVDGGSEVTAAGELRTAPAAVQTLTLNIKLDKQGDFQKTVEIKSDQGESAQLIVEGTAVP